MRSRARRLSIPFAGSWGLRPGIGHLDGYAQRFQSRLPGVGGSATAGVRVNPESGLSIPFAGSWGLRLVSHSCRRQHAGLSIPFAGSWGLRLRKVIMLRLALSFQSRLPGVGGSASACLRLNALQRSPFNPVCRELGAPPLGAEYRARGLIFQSRLPGVGGSAQAGARRKVWGSPFNPVCRELGAPPWRRGKAMARTSAFFQSRLPGVGGSAPDGRHGHRALARLSIPFAGSWGLRLNRGARGRRVPPPSFNPVCRELGAPPRG